MRIGLRPTSAPARGCRLFVVRPPVQTITQQFAGLEEWDVLILDVDRLASAGIAPGPRIARLDRKAPNPRNSTRSPQANAMVMLSNTVTTILSTWSRVR